MAGIVEKLLTLLNQAPKIRIWFDYQRSLIFTYY